MADNDKQDDSAANGQPPGVDSAASVPAEQASPAKDARRTGPRTGKRKAGGVTEVPSTGHEWDGIREYDNPLPRWWLWTFYATIVWALIYTIFYPAWPLINGATQGILHTNYRKELAAEIQRYDDANADIQQRLIAADINAIADDPELVNYASNAGRAVFATWCAQCHGSGAAGAKGYPNLLDNDWLWGGSMEDIHLTVTHGIRSADDADARYSEMPRFGTDQMLDRDQIEQATHYVLQISGQDHDAALAATGTTVFADNCTACHMEDGTGDRMQGAPDLTDAVWLYGGDPASIRQSIHDARFGVMPNWSPRLSEDDIRAVTYYVHSLGGGE